MKAHGLRNQVVRGGARGTVRGDGVGESDVHHHSVVIKLVIIRMHDIKPCPVPGFMPYKN